MTNSFRRDSGLAFLSSVVHVANVTARIGERVLYDSSISPAFTIFAPPSPKRGDKFGVTNVSTVLNGHILDGNGNLHEEFTAPGSFMATSGLVGSFLYTAWEFDGIVWRTILRKP